VVGEIIVGFKAVHEANGVVTTVTNTPIHYGLMRL